MLSEEWDLDRGVCCRPAWMIHLPYVRLCSRRVIEASISIPTANPIPSVFRDYWAANVAITAVQFVPVLSPKLPVKDPAADAIAASFAARELPVSCCASANGATAVAVPPNVAGNPTAENISSFGFVLATVGVVAVEPLPDAPPVPSRGFVVLSPLYS